MESSSSSASIWPDLRCEVHGTAKAPSIARLENVPPKSCRRDCLDRPVRGSDDLISAAIRIARSWTRPAANYVAWRHRASHCRMDRSPNHGGLRLGGRAELSGSRSGLRLRRGIYPTHSSDGHSRQTDSAAISLAERLCRTTDRLDQTRMPGSRDHNWRATPAPYPAFVPAILQRHPNAPVIGQGLTANEIRPGSRSHSSAAGPRRIAPSLRPNLIFDRHRHLGGAFARWAFATDRQHRDRLGRTVTLNG